MLSKCLLCDFNDNNSIEQMKRHYINVRKVDEKNKFFINFFKLLKNVFCGKKCLRCDEFLPTTYFKKVHDFLIHYGLGRNVFEEKPVDYNVIGEIQKYQITFSEHSNDYDFYNSESSVDDFLLNVKNRIKRSDSDFIIRCGFSLKNIQPSPFENEEPIASS